MSRWSCFRLIQMRSAVRIKVPATVGNLGPGFDVLGMALDIYNTLAVEQSEKFRFDIFGEGAGELRGDQENLIYRSLSAAYWEVGKPVPPLHLTCHNEIPLRRGLGSSAAAVVAGLVSANLLLGKPLSQERLLSLAAQMEGHADNVAPALLGGCQIVVPENGRVTSLAVSLPLTLRAVLFIPDFTMSTAKARAILPTTVRREDAVYNLGRLALLVASLTSGKLNYLRLATQDRLHQPWRKTLFPAMEDIFAAALEGGALGVFLSGAGSSILALAENRTEEIGRAMQEAGRKAGMAATIRVARPTTLGTHEVQR